MSRKRPPRRAQPGSIPAPAVAAPAAPGPPSVRWAPLLALAAALLVLDVYALEPIRHNGFITYDDPLYVSENPDLTHGLTGQAVAWAFTTGRAANWHPLTWLSHLLDVQLFGLAPGPQHLMSLALHAVSTIVLFLTLVRLTGRTGPSAAVAALFGVHPAHVESVAWIAERKDVLSGLFWWLTMWTYGEWARRPSAGRYALVAVLFALGLMAKPMLVTLPVVLLFLDVWPLKRLPLAGGWAAVKRDLRARVLEKLPLAGLAVASSIVTFIVQRQGGAVSDLTLLPAGTRIANAFASYARYLGKAIWPSGLEIYYPFSPTPPYALAIAAAVGLVAVTVGLWRLRARAPYLMVGWLWYVVTLLPVIGFIQVGSQAMADRYTYVPFVGLFLAAVWAAADVARRWPKGWIVMTTAGAAVLLACATTARAQTTYWADGTTIWQHALDVGRDNYVALDALGAIRVSNGQIDEGLADLRDALAISPAFPDTHYNIGVGLMKQHKDAEAEVQYREALRLKPSMAEAHGNLGLVLARQNRLDEAAVEYRESIRLEPDRADTHAGLGAVLARQGQHEAALAEYQTAARLAPSDAGPLYQSGLSLAALSRLPQAIDAYTEAIRLNPRLADAYNDRGFARFAQGRTAEALEDYDAALRVDPSLAAAWNNRGFAFATAGRLPEAIHDFTEAVRVSPTFVSARVNLGLALGGTGHLAEAAAQFREVLKLDPGNTTARRALASMGRH